MAIIAQSTPLHCSEHFTNIDTSSSDLSLPVGAACAYSMRMSLLQAIQPVRSRRASGNTCSAARSRGGVKRTHVGVLLWRLSNLKGGGAALLQRIQCFRQLAVRCCIRKWPTFLSVSFAKGCFTLCEAFESQPNRHQRLLLRLCWPLLPNLQIRACPDCGPWIDAADTEPAAQLSSPAAAFDTAARGASMPPAAALPALPSDLLAHIARVALAAEGSTVPLRVRLSLVCRDWRESLRGTQPALTTAF